MNSPLLQPAVLKEARVGHPTLVLNVPLAQQVGFTRAEIQQIALNEYELRRLSGVLDSVAAFFKRSCSRAV